MKFRQTDMPAVAAAKASFSTSTAYRFEKDRRLPSQKKARRERRPAGRYLCGGDCADVESGSRSAIRRHLRGDAETASRPRDGNPPNPGAADPRLACPPWARAGGDLPTDPQAWRCRIFTDMNTLGITVAREPLEHRLYHFRLAYSGFEHAHVVLGGESFVALAEGLQNARSAARLASIAPTAFRPPSTTLTWRPATIRAPAMRTCAPIIG